MHRLSNRLLWTDCAGKENEPWTLKGILHLTCNCGRWLTTSNPTIDHISVLPRGHEKITFYSLPCEFPLLRLCCIIGSEWDYIKRQQSLSSTAIVCYVLLSRSFFVCFFLPCNWHAGSTQINTAYFYGALVDLATLPSHGRQNNQNMTLFFLRYLYYKMYFNYIRHVIIILTCQDNSAQTIVCHHRKPSSSFLWLKMDDIMKSYYDKLSLNYNKNDAVFILFQPPCYFRHIIWDW